MSWYWRFLLMMTLLRQLTWTRKFKESELSTMQVQFRPGIKGRSASSPRIKCSKRRGVEGRMLTFVAKCARDRVAEPKLGAASVTKEVVESTSSHPPARFLAAVFCIGCFGAFLQ